MAKPVTHRMSGMRAAQPRRRVPLKTASQKASENSATDNGESAPSDGGLGEAEPERVAAVKRAAGVKRPPASATSAATAKASATAKTKAAVKRTAAVQPRSLVQRVYRAIETELAKLEQQKGASSQDRERASRALSQMVNSLEKAIDMQRDIVKSTAPRAKAKDTEALRHAEDLRRQIAERLERLQPKRRTGGGTR